MDPNLFAIDGERLFEVLLTIVVLSFFVERALAVLFETGWFVDWSSKHSKKGVKEMIALGVAFAVCRFWDFDALSILLVKSKTQLWGQALTAAIIAGGSKASIKFFHDVIDAKSSAETERQKVARSRVVAPVADLSG